MTAILIKKGARICDTKALILNENNLPIRFLQHCINRSLQNSRAKACCASVAANK